MKTKRKALVAVLCAAAFVATTFVATVAWLTDTEEVTNTFTVGKVDIKVDEAVVNEEGKPLDTAGNVVDKVEDAERTETKNEYHLMPGQTYVKDPTMTVLKGSDESYVRMIVTFNKGAEIEAPFGDPFLPQNFVDGWDNTKWVTTGVITEENNTLSYEFRYCTTVDARDGEKVLEPLFTSFTLPTTLTGEQVTEIGNLTITVEGHAVQTAGFVADTVNNKTAEDVAWEAFAAQLAATNP